MSRTKVMLIGLETSAVDFEKWPQLTPEKLEAGFKEILAELSAAGFEPRNCLVDTGATAEQVVTDTLNAFKADVVVIGAGVRNDPDHLLLFEKVINLVTRHAPGCRLAFNTLPFDTVDAVRRWA
ncbi:MAG: hypothetical protein AAF743_12495 [Planctomycetota bacterium]